MSNSNWGQKEIVIEILRQLNKNHSGSLNINYFNAYSTPQECTKTSITSNGLYLCELREVYPHIPHLSVKE